MANILIVDDDSAVLYLLSEVLTRAGHTVFEAREGKEASELYRFVKIDLCVLDLMMPEQDGIETLNDIRSLSPNAKIIVFSSAVEFLPLMEDFGADATIGKPLTREGILDAVARVMGE